MSTISKNLQGFLFNGATVALASAAFKTNINVLYGFNAAGTGYTSFRPTSTFNSLTQLEQDKSYILDAATLGFELPGATLVVGAVAAVNPISVEPRSIIDFGGTPMQEFKFTSTDPADSQFNVYSCNDDDLLYLQLGFVDRASFSDNIPFVFAPGEAVNMFILTNGGNVLRYRYAFPVA